MHGVKSKVAFDFHKMPLALTVDNLSALSNNLQASCLNIQYSFCEHQFHAKLIISIRQSDHISVIVIAQREYINIEEAK